MKQLPSPHVNSYRGDSQSYRYESKISVTYREHPQKDGLLVVGEVAYPNLDFEYTKVCDRYLVFGSLWHNFASDSILRKSRDLLHPSCLL